jgi:O-antigen ligase
MMLFLGLISVLRLPFRRQFKIALIAGVLLVGLAGFFWKYSVFFQKGATSVSARFDYWRAALQTVQEKPILGTGPGTFAIAYAKVKRPESEMSRLVHNDYLEQASDSGMAGLVFYALFIFGALAWSFPRARSNPTAGPEDWLGFAVWLGVLGWSLQSCVEFGLYIPALAWPAFAFLGWLLGTSQMDSTNPRRLHIVAEE